MILGCIFLNRNLPSLLKVSYILRMASDPPAGVCVCYKEGFFFSKSYKTYKTESAFKIYA